jgi:amino acid permease
MDIYVYTYVYLSTFKVLFLTLYSMGLVLKAKKWVHAQPQWINVEESKRPQSFQSVGRELLGLRGEKVIIVFVAMMQLGICMVFFNFSATELMAVEEYYSRVNATSGELADPTDSSDGLLLGKPELIFAAAPIALALSLGRSPTIIVVSASIATVIMYVTIGTILALVAWHFYRYFPGWPELQLEPLKPSYLPIAFGNLVYTVTTSIGILLPIENSLGPRAKTKYGTIVASAMSTTLVLDLAVGLLANMAFGKQTHESITAEFIEENIGHPEYVIGINVALALSVLLTYPLQFRPACEVVEAALGVAIEEDDDAENGLLLQDGVKQRSWWQTWG